MASLVHQFRKRPEVRVRRTYDRKLDVLIAHNDVLEFTKTVPSAEFQLIVTSPPYNIGKPYEERREFVEYLEWQDEVLKECVRVLKPGGSLCWQVGNYVENGEVFPLDMFFYQLIKRHAELRLRNRIVWHYAHGQHAEKRLSGRYETILWFTKGEPYTFNLDPIRVPQKYPGKRHFKGPNKGKPSSNPLGKNPGDVWELLQEEWDTSFWDIPNVKAYHREKTIHPAQFPVELVERFVLALTNPRDIVFDPFVGVGSTLIAALLLNRRSVGVDRNKQYIKIARRRIRLAAQGKLKLRHLGTKKFVPGPNLSVAQIPPEWAPRPGSPRGAHGENAP